MIQIKMKKFPHVCGDCPFMNTDGDYPYCIALKEDRGYLFDIHRQKFPNCPLTEIDVEVKDKDREMAKQKEMLHHLFNRCRVMNNGPMCIFCAYRNKCREDEKNG